MLQHFSPFILRQGISEGRKWFGRTSRGRSYQFCKKRYPKGFSWTASSSLCFPV